MRSEKLRIQCNCAIATMQMTHTLIYIIERSKSGLGTGLFIKDTKLLTVLEKNIGFLKGYIRHHLVFKFNAKKGGIYFVH